MIVDVRYKNRPSTSQGTFLKKSKWRMNLLRLFSKLITFLTFLFRFSHWMSKSLVKSKIIHNNESNSSKKCKRRSKLQWKEENLLFTLTVLVKIVQYRKKTSGGRLAREPQNTIANLQGTTTHTLN